MTEKCTVIFMYSREQAIADGVLIDVTEAAKEVGLNIPVALTATVWAKCIAIPPHVKDQDERGRLRDLLWTLFVVIRTGRYMGSEIHFQLHALNDHPWKTRSVSELKAFDELTADGIPCLTVMLPEED